MEYQGSPSRRRSTPAKASSSSALLVPASIARPSMGRLFSGSNKENASTPDNSNHNNNNAQTPYDAFMSPLKSAMKAYPVMSPFKKRRISFASPLRQCSPNTSIRSRISERDEQDTTMASATASVLDDLFQDEEHEQGDRTHEGASPTRQEEQQESSMVQETPILSLLQLHAPTSAMQCVSGDIVENVTSHPAASPSKQSQTSATSPLLEHTAAQDCSVQMDHAEESSFVSLPQEQEALIFPSSPDMTALAANIPLPPSPAKPTSTQTPKSAASPRKSHLMNTITKLAANVPLPNSPSPAKLAQSRASTSEPVSQSASTPLLERTAQAAMIPLPQSAAPVSRALKFQVPPIELPQAGTGISTDQILPFADQDSLDSPVKASSSTLHQLPFARSTAVPSPLKQQQLTQAQQSSPEQNELPFAQADTVDSPVKHMNKAHEKHALKDMPFAREQFIPSPAKLQLPVLQLSRQTDDASMECDTTTEEDQTQAGQLQKAEDASMNDGGDQDDEEPAANASRLTISEAGSPLHIDAPVAELLVTDSREQLDGQEEEAEEGQDEMIAMTANESRITISEAGSPLQIDALEAEVLVQDEVEQGHSSEDLDAVRENFDFESFALDMSATPARPIQHRSSQATPSIHGPASGASLPTTNAPATKKRTLARSSGEVSQQDASSSSVSKRSTSDTLNMDATSQETPTEEQNESSMLQTRTKVSAKMIPANSKSLKRKASASSIVSRDDDNGQHSEESIQPTRRLTRQRSLTALRDPQPAEVVHVLQVPTQVETPAPSASVKGKGRASQQGEGTEDLETAATNFKSSSKAIPRTRRQSTRLASTSGLPQPKSRIAVKSTTPKAVTPKATSQQTDSTSKAEESASSDEAEENMPTVSSRPAVPARQQITVPPENLQTLVAAPAARRPQRSARPARNLLPDAKPLPSPRRVMSPVKKPLRAARAVTGATSASHSTRSIIKDGSHSEESSQTTTAKMAPRSPGRVLLSPAKSNSQPLRSPGRAPAYQPPRSPRQAIGSTFDWSSAPSHGQASTVSQLPRTLSPNRYRKAASKIFGSASDSSLAQSSASSGPASSAASATGLTSQTSPFKGLAQRLTLSGSPSLLGISMAPELLVLAPPSPSPTKTEGDTPVGATASSAGPSMLRASTSSAPESKRFSPTSQVSPQNLSLMQSPRRALSAQPMGAVPRHELPSPRRVPLASRAATGASTTAANANMGTPVRTASRVFSAPSARSSALSTSQVSASTASTSLALETSQGTADDEAPRRSQRSARPQRAVQAIKKEAPSAPAAVASQVTRAKPTVTAAQLQTLTNQNTSANRKLYNKHKVTVIHKDEDRPPSPTSKIRKIGEEASNVAKAESSKDGKTAKSALAQATKARQESGQTPTSLGSKRPHFTAAGDEGIYESPVKKARREESESQQDAEKAAKRIKWDRDLLKASQKMYTPPGPGKAGGTKVPSRPVVRNKALEMDGFGNVPDCKASLSPIVPRSKVDITKIIYRDDDEED